MSPRNPIILYVLMFVFNGAALFLYVTLQIFLVMNTLHDLWPIGRRQSVGVLMAQETFSLACFSLC